ncbi:protein kinase [Nocardia cyriacigeorgica]|uniref:serine/threonine-protein kinase n=1 Tax=Nocardia cyriacigeorgica TaxID=135487 RepID=UPI0018953044|nr:serine/threonine-protein kinase [Nocardia cyriacigeorgica]MBF6425677.1 protein kinase [Nocardia cyriacigeorgica]
MALSPGTVIGGYRIVKALGAGGMGAVYLAKHPSLPRMDALKVLSPELSRDPEFRVRFEREANIAAGLDHANIVSVFNRGDEGGQLWISMQYIEGTDASAILADDRHSMTPLRALRIVTEVGKGLDYAHRRGLLHRDVKPANFLISSPDSGEDERVLLTDFGVAKAADDASELTKTGSMLATIAYAPPEQLTGQPLDHRADIYSLACSLFKLVTGQNPYPGAQPAMVMMGHLHKPPPAASAVNPGLPAALDHVFAKAMAKNPAERFNSCREFTDAAANALVPGHNPASSNTSPTYPVQVIDPRPAPESSLATSSSSTRSQQRRRRRWPAVVGAAVVVVGVAVGGTALAMSGKDSSRSTEAAMGGATPTAEAQTPIGRARQSNPAFQGKTITLIDFTENGSPAVYLSPSPQTKFFEDLGFVYNFSYEKQGDEPSPQPIDTSRLKADRDSYVLVVRSDSEAGGGGLSGLPFLLTGSVATVIALDDPTAVAALRNWSENSESVLIERAIPALQGRIR